MDSGLVSGQKSSWSLVRKLGEGDAGEVFLVESLVEHRLAILKRPQRSVFTGEVRRQADQIRTEGRILKALEVLLGNIPNGRVCAPALLDQSKPGNDFGERFFIVIDRAPGFDLSFLARVSRLGMPNGEEIEATPDEITFLRELAHQRRLPDRVILSALSAVFSVFGAIHEISHPPTGVEASGILWNDVKPDHLFWDPRSASITIIDWGNGQFLEPGGASRNLRHTVYDDRRQFLDEMGRFLASASPDLQARLDWPAKPTPIEEINPTLNMLGDRVLGALVEENQRMIKARALESELIQPHPTADENLPRIEEVHNQIVGLGEIPDYEGALRLAGGLVGNLAASGEMDRVRKLCAWAARLPGPDKHVESWQLLARLAQTAARAKDESKRRLVEAVQAGASGDWENALWGMLASLQAGPEPDGWNELVQQVRLQACGDEVASIRPHLTLRRMALTIQSLNQQLEDRLARKPNPEDQSRYNSIETLLETLRGVIQNWIQLEPLPPHSGLAYGEIEALFNEVEAVYPGGGYELQRVLEGSRTQVRLILEAWGRKEFVNASRELRQLLVLDPDRRRLLRADQAVQSASDWLLRLQHGPNGGVNLSEFVTALEYEGREMRNQMGPAGWLDGILESLKSIRQGAWPGDLLSGRPWLLNEMSWLQKFARVEVVNRILRPNLPAPPMPSIRGMRETRYGPDAEITFVEPLDAWMPEARGSSARVYLSTYLSGNDEQREAALKIMRFDKADYATPLFREEVQVLTLMQDIPGVSRMLECGFLWMDAKNESLPLDHNLGAIQLLRGDALRIGPDSSAKFLELLDEQVKQGWTPYLLVEKRKREDSLLLMCDASLNRGRFLPVPDLLFMCVQICDILQAAHERNVVYLDHKILHYYWLADTNGIAMIDWNVARYHPNGLTPYDVHMDLVQLGARGLHHILTGRTAPGALPMGPTRPEEIEQAAESYAAQWTYDDQRLSSEVRIIMEQLLSGSYISATDLQDDLKRAYMHLE
jgi:serine/threonine protein kinase